MTEVRSCFAIVTPGFEAVVAAELRALALADVVPVEGGVTFRADDAGLLATNLHVRAATRIVVRIAEFTAKSFAELERRAKPVKWGAYIGADRAAAFRVTCKKSRLYHSDAVAQRLARSLVAAVPRARVMDAGGDDEPTDEPKYPATDGINGEIVPFARELPRGAAQLFVVRFAHDVCTISADASGELLHRRGYRLATAKAPIRETIAAGCLLALGYDGSAPLVDPMCGAGTFAIEAALIARNIAPGINRSFACESWPGFDAAAARRARASARAAEREAPAAAIHASDRDAGAARATRANAERAGVARDIAVWDRTLSAIEPPAGAGLLVANPPYGARVGEGGDLRNLYAQLGNVARERLHGWRVALVSADQALDAQAKLGFAEVLRFSNGGIKVRLVATPPLQRAAR